MKDPNVSFCVHYILICCENVQKKSEEQED